MIKLNGFELIFKTFPNGETLVDGDQLTDHLYPSFNKIEFKFENDGDLIKLMFVKNYLDDKNLPVSLKIYYMMYSRMDRVEGKSVFTLKYISNFINSLNFVNVEVIEPHSNVTLALLNRSFATYPTIELLDSVMNEIGFDKNEDYLFFPDMGAMARYKNIVGFKQLVGFKNRDFQTGEIKSLEIIGSKNLKNCKVLILDDLTSYGTTFLKSGEQLKILGAEKVSLFITHCEYSVYKGKLLETDYIDKIFTTNSIINYSEHEKIKVIKL